MSPGLLRWWHLLSLDAPTVAAVWACLFARIVHIELSCAAPLMLALGTWLVYIADRLLDGMALRNREMLRERHHFYIRNRLRFVFGGLLGSLILLGLIATKMDSATRRNYLVVSCATSVYFVAVHLTSYRVPTCNTVRAGREINPFRKRVRVPTTWLPKEAAVGILFAAATAVPAWSKMENAGAARSMKLAFSVVVFAVLCWLNCIAIERWERTHALSNWHPHVTTEWAGNHLSHIAPILCGLALCLSLTSWVLPDLRSLLPMFLSAALSAMVFIALGHYKNCLSTLQLRVGADAALLTPVLFLVTGQAPLLR